MGGEQGVAEWKSPHMKLYTKRAFLSSHLKVFARQKYLTNIS